MTEIEAYRQELQRLQEIVGEADYVIIQGVLDRFENQADRIQALVDEQAKDPALWRFINARASEAHMQRALRELHAAIEDAP